MSAHELVRTHCTWNEGFSQVETIISAANYMCTQMLNMPKNIENVALRALFSLLSKYFQFHVFARAFWANHDGESHFKHTFRWKVNFVWNLLHFWCMQNRSGYSRWALVCLNLCKPYSEQHVVFRRHVSNIHSCHESKIFAIWCIESVSGTLCLGSCSIALVTVWYLLEMLIFLSLISAAQQQR